MTETEAKTKICPLVAGGRRCEASACMMWRWFVCPGCKGNGLINKRDFFGFRSCEICGNGKPIAEGGKSGTGCSDRGYCGLAGQPNKRR